MSCEPNKCIYIEKQISQGLVKKSPFHSLASQALLKGGVHKRALSLRPFFYEEDNFSLPEGHLGSVRSLLMPFSQFDYLTYFPILPQSSALCACRF